MKKLFLLSATLLGLFIGMNAQDTTDVTEKLSKRDIARSKYKRAVMLVPQYASIGGLRIDFEFRTGNNSITFGPAFYVDKSSDGFMFYNNYKSMVGAGMDVTYKINLINPNKAFVPYGAINVGYSWKQITTDVEYYYGPIFETNMKEIGISKMAVDALVGFQLTPVPRFVIDISGGVGGRYSIADSNQDYVDDYFSGDINDIAYTGILPVCNIKLGIKF